MRELSEMVLMNDDEDNEITEESQVLIRIDENERSIRRSVISYLMWHSGQVFTNDSIADSVMRGTLIDDLGKEAISRIEDLGITTNTETRNAVGSLHSQVNASPNTNIPIFLVDVTAIGSGVGLPLNQPKGVSLNTPPEVMASGIVFTNYEQFRTSYNQLGTHILTAPKSVLFWLQRFEREFLHIADPRIRERAQFHRIKPEWRFTNPLDHSIRSFENLSQAMDVGRLVNISGQVTEVGEIKVILTHIAFRCLTKNEFGVECGQITLVEQQEEKGDIIKPSECICGGKNFIKLSSKESRNEAMQRVTIQEEEIGGEARSLMIELRGTLCNTNLPGRSIEVTGTIQVEPITKNSLVCTQYMLGTNYRILDNSITEIAISKQDEEEIQAFIDSSDLDERMKMIIDSWAGHIYALEDLKKAIILQSCRAPAEEKFGHRSAMHILVVGDPGTAKSKMLKLATNLSLGSRFVSADNATQAGLTGACAQVEDLYSSKKRWAVLPGDLGLTHPDAVCAIDEFNLYKGDFGDFNNAMESGEVTISKVVKARIPTKCSILAGANPKGKDSDRKRFNRNNQVPYSTQLGLEFTVMQRFDAIFVLEDIADKTNDEKVAISMLQGLVEDTSKKTEVNLLSLEFIRKYLAKCRNQPVKLSKKAAEYIASTHSSKRSEAVDEESMRSHRQVASLARFTLAAARFDGVTLATLKHVRYAEDLLKNTLQERDPGAIDGGMTADARDLRKRVAEEFVNLIKANFWLDSHKVDEIYSEMSNNWGDIPTMDKVDAVLRDFSRNRVITNIRRTSNGVYSYEGVENPATAVW